MAEKFKLTPEDKQRMLSNSWQILPDNPSDKGFSADQIKKLAYTPSSMLFDWMAAGFENVESEIADVSELINKKLDKTDIPDVLYGTTHDGTQSYYDFSINKCIIIYQ